MAWSTRSLHPSLRPAWSISLALRGFLMGAVLIGALATAQPASADPGSDTCTIDCAHSPAGYVDRPSADELSRLALKEANVTQLAGTFAPNIVLPGGDVGTQSCCTTYETVSIPIEEQETWYWCGPATIQSMLQASRIDKFVSQTTLASEMGTTSGSGTYVYKMRNALNDHTIYDPNIEPQMPNNWIWDDYQVTNVTDLVNRHMSDLVEDLPTVFHVISISNNGSYSLVGWTVQNGHFVAGHGYREGDLVSAIRYMDPYDNPETHASLGSHWFGAYPMWVLIDDRLNWIVY